MFCAGVALRYAMVRDFATAIAAGRFGLFLVASASWSSGWIFLTLVLFGPIV